MKVLVVGAGGREHALCWAISKSPKCGQLYCAPGNAGIAAIADCIDIDAEDVPAPVAFACDNLIDLVVSPEAPLVLGLVNDSAARHQSLWSHPGSCNTGGLQSLHEKSVCQI